MFDSSRKDQLAGPRFQRIENDHSPIQQRAESFQAENKVEGETVGGTGGDANAVGQFGVDKTGHGRPYAVARIADGIGVVKEEKVEFVGAATGEGLFGGHAEIIGVIAGWAKGRIGEPWKTARSLTLAFVKIVANGADEAIILARETGEGHGEQFVGGAAAIDISGDKSANALIKGAANQGDPAFIGKRFAEIHKPPAVPCAKSRSSHIHFQFLILILIVILILILFPKTEDGD